MNYQDAKKIVRAYLIKQNTDILPIKRNSVFLMDCGFYVIIVGMVPWYGAGFLLDVAVKLLWTKYDGLIYTYSNGDARLNVPDHPLGAIDLESPQVEQKIDQLMQDAQVAISEYRELRDFDTFKYKIENRKDFIQIANPGFEKRDISLTIAKMFSGDQAKALEILHTASEGNEDARVLLENSENLVSFQTGLLALINYCRGEMAKKYKIKLPPITTLWEH